MADLVLFPYMASAVPLMGCTAAARLAECAVQAAADRATLRGALDVTAHVALQPQIAQRCSRMLRAAAG